MRRLRNGLVLLVSCWLLLATAIAAPQKSDSDSKKPAELPRPMAGDLTKEPTLYVVPYAHLDTQWRWEYPQVIREYLAKTMRDNFALFEKYPHYVFNFSGANRYRMMKEYYPEDYEKLQQYVAAGRWFPAGSSMEENDVNNPTAESILRQVLYGKEYFRHDFGKTSAEYMLPDCFGFPASLPSILAHAGIKGFSTQKLSWHSGSRVGGPNSPEQTPEGIPFNVGVWEGTDGHSVIAALNGMTYSGDVTYDISKAPTADSYNPEHLDWVKRLDLDGKASGVFTDFYYYGTGDTGGSPRESSVKLMEEIVTHSAGVIPRPRQRGQEQAPPVAPSEPVVVGDGPVKVLQVSAEQMFLDIKPDQLSRMPRYKGDLELVEHSAGSLTSEAYQKRWNRRNEVLADDAERASVVADWLGARPYPLTRLTDAWTLVMAGQFHDIVPGTSTPKAYEFSWNDANIATNQFATVLHSATSAVASAMNTQTRGIPVVVYNPLSIAREDVVEANIALSAGQSYVRVVGPDGSEAPAQVSNGKVVFLASVPPVGYAVFDVQPMSTPPVRPTTATTSQLKVSESSLENGRYLVKLDQNGDVSSIMDKAANKEMLSSPIRLALKTDRPVDWPAWNMDWNDQKQPPRAYVSGPAKIRVVENGPARVAVEVEREAEGSKFVQTVRLASGDAGNRVEFSNVIDWKMQATNLKAVFPLTVSNPQATYNWDIGTIQRGNDDEKKYEVASHQWFDLTAATAPYGVTVLSDAKNGSDKPDDSTLRLTLIRTPGIGTGNGRDYADQTTQDWGHHEFVYGVAGHQGGWRQAQTDWQGWRLNQPLLAFEAAKHAGTLGKSFSLVKVSNSRVRVMALKKAEASDEYVIRMVELDGRPQVDVHVAFAFPITAAREVNGAEEPVGAATVQNGELIASFTGYQPRTFAFKLSPPMAKAAATTSKPVTLTYDHSVATRDGRPGDGGFDSQGRAYAFELLPEHIDFAGVRFDLAKHEAAAPNAVTAHGQTIALPEGGGRVYLLASAEGDQKATFRVGNDPVELTIQDWSGDIGQWDTRLWKQVEVPVPAEPAAGDTSNAAQRARRMRERVRREGPIYRSEYTGLLPGFTKPAPIAWFRDHRHSSDGSNDAYAYSYLFAYAVDLPAGARTLVLPDNDRIRIFAITVADQPVDVKPTQPLFDALDRSHVADGFYGPATK